MPDDQTQEPGAGHEATAPVTEPAAPVMEPAAREAEPAAEAALDPVAGSVAEAAADVHGPEVPEAPAVLDEATLARVATPGVVRRAPRFGAFIGFGAVLGLVVGVVLAAAFDRGDLAGEGGGVLPFLGGSNGARLVTGVAVAVVGALVGAALALWADARSRRRAH